MAFARLIIDGEDINFAGDIEDKFLGFTNTNTAARSGALYTESQASVKMVSVSDVMANPAELERLKAYFADCGTRAFIVTIVLDENCGDTSVGRARYIYTGCRLEGDSPTVNLITKKVSDFAFAYENVTAKDFANV